MNPIKHGAIIMDGNGRWGIKNKKSRNFGHKEGLKSVENIIKVSIDNKIKFLTIRRKYTLGYTNFIRGQYDLNNESLLNLINIMTLQEAKRINDGNVSSIFN